MPENQKGPSPFMFWLEEALSGWILPLAAVALVLCTGALYMVGVASENLTGGLLVVVAPLVVAVIMVRPAFESARSSTSRGLVCAAAGVTLLVAAVPAFRSIFPGSPIFEGSVAAEHDAIAIPGGISGRVRLLVKGELPKGGAPRAEFTLSGTREPIDGVLERTFATARVGRSGRAQVASDHVSEFHSATIAPGATALRLDRVVGKLGGPIQVFAYRHWLTPTELVLLSLLVLFLVAAVDAWAGLQGNTAVASGMALVFGLLVASYATPFASVGQALGGAVLGAMTGALAGSIAGAVMRKFVPQGRRRAGGGKAGNGKPGSKTDSAAAA